MKTLKNLQVGEKEAAIVRKEAMEWINACEKPVDFTRNDRCGTNQEYCEKCRWIKMFFNLE